MTAVLLIALFALPAFALAEHGQETASDKGLSAQSSGLTISTNTIGFILYPDYTQGQSVRAITVTNNTGSTVTDIHFANFQGTTGAFADGSHDYSPYVVVDQSGRYPLSDCFFEADSSGSVPWTDWAIEEGYASLEPGESRTYNLAIERDGMWPCLSNGTNLTDTIDLVSSAGSNSLTLQTRVYEPEAGIARAQVGTKNESTDADVAPISNLTLSSFAAGSDGTGIPAKIVGLQNKSSSVDPVTGAKPDIVVKSVAIENDSLGIFSLGYYSGTWATPIGSGDTLNLAIGPEASCSLAVSADASFVPAGTYTATLCFYVVPSTVKYNSGVNVQATETSGVSRVSVPISVTVTGSNPNLRAAPGNLKGEAGNGIAVISWDAVPANSEGYAGYVVWRTGGGDPVTEYVDAANTQFIDRGVENGKTYTYYVGCQNGGSDEQLFACPKAGPVSITPSATAAMKLDAPDLDSNLDSLIDAVRASWYLQDWNDNGLGTIDHFNVYLNKKLVATVPQAAVKNDGRHGSDVYYWICDVPVKVPWQQYYVNVSAVAVDGTEGFLSDTAFGSASSGTPTIASAQLQWDYEMRTIEASANVWCDTSLSITTHIDRDGARIATVESGDSFIDRNVQQGRTYTYTFTATASNGKTSEPYKVSIYASPNGYEDGESVTVPITVAPSTDGDDTAINITIDSTPSTTYVVKRDGGDGATITATGETVELVDHPGTGVHEYKVERQDGDGSAVASSQTKRVEITSSAQPGSMTIVSGAWYGTSGNVDPAPAADTQSMHRLYNPNSGEHFYTADDAERDHLASIGWNYEGVGWTAPKTSSIPVYRLYNANGGEHHYTPDISERDFLVAAGWNDEGTGWYSDDARTTPLFRDYNPNAFANNHNYTVDVNEHEFLVSLGWRDEGIAWYGV